MAKHTRPKSALILLVVLSMLALFSLLSITYVVFSSQSRTASMAMARRDHHRIPPERMMDYAIKEVLRGSTGTQSAIGAHSLLADVYGHTQSLLDAGTLTRARFTSSGDQAEFFANRFLRIPLDTSAAATAPMPIPTDREVLTGRVLTFLKGPLSGFSFRILRSLGPVTAVPEVSNSVIIDLTEASGPQSGSKSVQSWMSGGAAAARNLCQDTTAGEGYLIRINDRENNGLGYGMGSDGTVQLFPVAGSPVYPLPLNLLPLQQSLSLPTGDTDESYDAPDYNDVWLAYRRTSAIGAEDVIPSFHRAALINYIVNKEDISNPTTFTQDEFIAMLDQIQRACLRPLGIAVRNLESPPATSPSYSSANPDFSGANLGDFSTAASRKTSTLDIDLRDRWVNWTAASAGGGPSPYESFLAFVRFLTAGPWDVDNDGDSLNDSVWVDLDMPLITSPEGKLLKMLVAYYIEDLDGRLDLNAVGNLAQRTDATYVPATGNNAFSLPSISLPQGFGAGPAESSLRHFFSTDADYVAFLESRYGGTQGVPGEGTSMANVDDLRSRLSGGANTYVAEFGSLQPTGTRERRQTVRHDRLPGLPVAIRGGESLGFDRLGNPLLARGTSTTLANQGLDDPYEFRLIEQTHRDLPFSIGEWERIYRSHDWDVSMLPRRLTGVGSFGTNIRAVAPLSSHMRNVPLTAVGAVGTPIRSLYEMIVSIGQHRETPVTVLPSQAFRELFPLEFGRGVAMDLNRPFGNGIDDDLDGMVDEAEELLKNGIDDNGNGAFDELAELAVHEPSGASWIVGSTHRQRSVYIANREATTVAANDYPTTADIATGGYTGGNMDPQYEELVRSGLTAAPARNVSTRYHGAQGRQLLARNIYCLAMLLLPDNLFLSNRPGVALTGPDRARALAQWSVNVVDFRDADHAMTRFPYDPDPFTIEGSGTSYWAPNEGVMGAPAGEVVWGMEQPELLLTETLATHDYRVRDTTDDPSMRDTNSPTPDVHFDQYRIPQGSVFFELMVPRTTSTATDATVPGVAGVGTGNFYIPGTTTLELNLSAVTPSDGTTNYPVWRIAISEPHPRSATSPSALSLIADPSPITYQLPVDVAESNLNGLLYDRRSTGTVAAPVIQRLLWFANSASIVDRGAAAVGLPSSLVPADRARRVFYNSDASGISLEGGQYLVVGPRPVTYFGSKSAASSTHTNLPNNHRFVLENSVLSSGSLPPASPSWSTLYTGDNEAVLRRATMRMAKTMFAVMDAPWTSGTTTNLSPTVGISVSEPLPVVGTYYQTPTQVLNTDDTTGDATNGALGFRNLFRDAYHDYAASPPIAPTPLPDVPFDLSLTTPIGRHYEPLHPAGAGGVPAPSTEVDWCTAFLQRLADSERPWHVVFNPYITVDWMPIDLTVFSGEDTIAGSGFRFGSRQKNGAVGSARAGTFLSYRTDEPVDNNQTIAGTYFTEELPIDNATSLIATRPTIARPTLGNTASRNFSTFGYLNAPFGLLNEPGTLTVPANYVGSPSVPPQSLTWFNRPFVSPYEMMLVPMSAPGQLLQEFRYPATNSLVVARDHYVGPNVENVFSPLLNFFQELPGTQVLPARRTGFSPTTLFELVTVPSPWSDAESVIPPTEFSPETAREFWAIGSLAPPYNRIPKMIEPGRLNLNTMSEEAAWQGVEWNYMNATARGTTGPTARWTELVTSRRGYVSPPPSGVISNGNPNLHPEFPTEFGGLFKSPFSIGLVPTTRSDVLDQFSNANPAMVTVFRKSPTNNRPLFQIRSDVGVPTGQANPFNEYLPITRLANLTTARSNTFAVRVTVGYFEFDPATGIGQEYGVDNGKTKRHRAFYVIDRSIPVAFKPGEDLNTENCILMRRIIE